MEPKNYILNYYYAPKTAWPRFLTLFSIVSVPNFMTFSDVVLLKPILHGYYKRALGQAPF